MSHESRSQPIHFEVNGDRNGEYHVTPDSDDRASIAAIKAVAKLKDIDPLDMEPAYDGVNLNVLDSVFEWQHADNVTVGGPVTVDIAGHHVTLQADGRLTISPQP